MLDPYRSSWPARRDDTPHSQRSGGRNRDWKTAVRGRAGLGAGRLLLPTGTALAQEANQVTGVAVEQADGFASLSWDPVAGATDYQIERTPVGADNVPTGPAAIVGVWRPNRTVTPDSPTFADAGFNPGDRFQWRVRARSGTTAHRSRPRCSTRRCRSGATRPFPGRTCARSGR